MSLSEFRTNEAVAYLTNHLITESTYDQLRHYLLERKALTYVIDTVNTALQEHCDKDKEQIQQDLTKAACESQILSDEQDAFNDGEQQKTEMKLTQENTVQIPELKLRLEQLQSAHSLQSKRADLAHSSLKLQQDEERRIDSRLRNIRTQKNLLSLQYPYTLTNHTHYHGHYSNVVSTYPNTVYNWTFANQIQWNNLVAEEHQLLIELGTVRGRMSGLRSEYSQEQDRLDDLFTQIKQVEDSIHTKQRQLSIEFPQNEKTRQRRLEERAFRQSAREHDDPQLNQLSYRNRQSLNQQITEKNKALDKLKAKLLQEVIDLSYPAFLLHLEQTLHNQSTSKLLMNDIEALKMILNFMKEYQSLVEVEQRMLNAISTANARLEALQRNLETNTKLHNRNKQLIEESDSAANARTISLVLTGASAAGGAVSAFMLANMIIDPILFMVPGGLALFAITAAIFALVYHFQKSDCDRQIAGNNQSIQQNEVELLDNKEKKDNSTTPKPSLQQQINATEEELGNQSSQLGDLRQTMALQLNKAQNVTNTYQRLYPFMANNSFQAPTYQASIPTAPQVEPLTPYQVPTYNVDELLNYGGFSKGLH